MTGAVAPGRPQAPAGPRQPPAAGPPAPPVALVTGGTRGIGLAIAAQLAADGYDLLLAYHNDHAAAAATQRRLAAAHGVTVHVQAADVADVDAVERLFGRLRAEFGGRLTALVHNAGLYLGVTSPAPGQAALTAPAAWEAASDYYTRSYARFFQGAVEAGRRCPGLRHVVAISSPGCNLTQGPIHSYQQPGQAKAALEYLVRHYASVLMGRGVNVNCVVPGLVRTGAWERLFEGGGSGAEAALTGRFDGHAASPWTAASEVGAAVGFLCSAASGAITGCAIPVDGGLHLAHLANRGAAAPTSSEVSP